MKKGIISEVKPLNVKSKKVEEKPSETNATTPIEEIKEVQLPKVEEPEEEVVERDVLSDIGLMDSIRGKEEEVREEGPKLDKPGFSMFGNRVETVQRTEKKNMGKYLLAGGILMGILNVMI